MWIVRLALRRPYTFAVFALLILILGVFSILSMPTDIFPNIDIPVVTVVWNYSGLSAQEMSTRIVFNSERGMTTTVNDIEPLAAAFALAAVLSPTDAVALSGIVGKGRMPKP